jgi:PAS domain S-box-containing protein
MNPRTGIASGTADDLAAYRLAAIVENSSDAIISKDLNGIIQSWNSGARHLFGYEAAEVIGKSILILIPQGYEDEEPEILARIRRGERIAHYETERRRKDGSLVSISLTVSPIRDAEGTVIGASKIARDITERRRTELALERQRRLQRELERVSRLISQDLDLERTVQAVTDIATELTDAQFGAFFYNLIDDNGESYTLYTLSGAPRAAFETFGMPRNTAVFGPTFRGEGVVRSDNIREDPRYGHNAPHRGMPAGHLPVTSYLAVPVIGRSGIVIGGLFLGHEKPAVFTQDAEDLIVGIAGHAAIAFDNAMLHKAAQEEIAQRRRAEETQQLLLHEIQHRVKNTLGTVQAIATQTFKRAPREESAAFNARLQALAGAHDLLVRKNWESAALGDVISHALAPFRQRGQNRISSTGPEGELAADRALLLAMILHELGTNAVKYGALSSEAGTVEVAWTIAVENGSRQLRLEWRERGGPPVAKPTRKGFGSTLISKALSGNSGSAKLDFSPSGVTCRVNVPIGNLS